MKVWQCDNLRPVSGLVSAEVKTPQPGRGEVLIRVHAVGVTHTELLWQPTTHTRSVKSAEDERTKQALFFVEPNRQQSCDIAALLEAGRLWPVVGATVPFAQAAVVYAREPVHSRRPGKTVVTLIPPS
jgi:NADPH:quinone reductase-like Zn-dependent oxidoreductase